ncbi:RNA-directed DNA polymerase like [Apostasia shenzhenica]|uniref:RNA-directed DNA polymerase like n=1 Tax=Apostasia shenzhenica TaxID=1088818 RepID=A0A2I0ANP3_9ASPA|nr:RNA-directed DNA polymerase like [Apostasia shenzhenica]
MPGIDRAVAEHRLSLKPGVAPVRQKKRSFGGEKQRAIREEVEKLLAAEFIREITYPSWLANVVVVKKNSGKWRMCVDFTDLNKACLKDFYPLPKIDMLVDSSAGYSVMSFVDAFSGYHQIRMAEDDEEHTSFITDQGTFCYKVMPFGLKNACATYQRMIDTVFKNQRGRNIEAYVDDVLIKSKSVKQHIEDLRETLDTCRTYNIKLNPLKSIFGSSYNKFLGYMVSARGIEANPEKIQAIQDMKPPQTVQDIQKLNGRVTTLSRFISKSGERCLPFFKILRGENQTWSEDCARAFQSLKEYLLSPPLLSAPIQDDDLFLYLSATDNSVSAVLVREEAGRQHPIHYISHILHGAEVRYPPLEKPLSSPPMIKAIFWNCRGVKKSASRNHLQALVKEHSPVVICLLETRVQSFSRREADRLVGRQWDFYVESSVGKSGGIIVCWLNHITRLQVIHSNKQVVIVKATVMGQQIWHICAVMLTKITSSVELFGIAFLHC